MTPFQKIKLFSNISKDSSFCFTKLLHKNLFFKKKKFERISAFLKIIEFVLWYHPPCKCGKDQIHSLWSLLFCRSFINFKFIIIIIIIKKFLIRQIFTSMQIQNSRMSNSGKCVASLFLSKVIFPLFPGIVLVSSLSPLLLKGSSFSCL